MHRLMRFLESALDFLCGNSQLRREALRALLGLMGAALGNPGGGLRQRGSGTGGAARKDEVAPSGSDARGKAARGLKTHD